MRHIWTGLAAALVLVASLPAATVAASPSNDAFADATTIGALPMSVSGVTSGATTEAGEPRPQCSFAIYRTAWFRYTPTADGVISIAETPYDQAIGVYRDGGGGVSQLSFVDCIAYSSPKLVHLAAGVTYVLQVGQADDIDLDMRLEIAAIPPPGNDDFADAAPIAALPYHDQGDAIAATLQPGEPATCRFGEQTTWYRFTPTDTEFVTTNARAPQWTLGWFTGDDLADLHLVGCSGSGPLTFKAMAGTTYRLRVSFASFLSQSEPFDLDVGIAPDVTPAFGSSPTDPSSFDTIQFNGEAGDPASGQVASFDWSFGDGATATGQFPTHQYASDGRYQVTLSVAMTDGRTGTSVYPVEVRTHDVAIAKVEVPTSARSGQNRTISVGIRTGRYPDTVAVTLWRSSPSGYQMIGTVTKDVPVAGGNRTVDFGFGYTFSAEDAQTGKVTFQAIAEIVGARDALPADNRIVTAPTKVSR
jgi:hypothetical protein